MHSQTPPPLAIPSEKQPPAADLGRWGWTLAILLLGWVGIALITLFIRGLIAQPTGLILMGLMLACGWTLVTLMDALTENK